MRLIDAINTIESYGLKLQQPAGPPESLTGNRTKNKRGYVRAALNGKDRKRAKQLTREQFDEVKQYLTVPKKDRLSHRAIGEAVGCSVSAIPRINGGTQKRPRASDSAISTPQVAQA